MVLLDHHDDMRGTPGRGCRIAGSNGSGALYSCWLACVIRAMNG
jgi:hypothetical protein